MMVRIAKKKTFLIVSIIIVCLGILAFVLAYGLSKGWDVVGAWFSSKYAIILYIVVGCYFAIVLWWIIGERIKNL